MHTASGYRCLQDANNFVGGVFRELVLTLKYFVRVRIYTIPTGRIIYYLQVMKLLI